MIWSRFLRILGILLILSFSVGSMFLSYFVREIDPHQSPKLKNTLSFTSVFEDRFYDYRMKKTLNRKNRFNDIVLAKVDDESLKVIGRWPWKREVWADILGKFKGYGAKVLAFDAIFSEPELVCGVASGDQAFKGAISDFQSVPGNKVILAYSTVPYNIKGETLAELPEELFNFILDTKQEEGFNLKQKWVQSTTYPIKELLSSEPGLGYIDNESDVDGVFRYYPLVTNVDSLYFPSMGLSAYMSHTGKSVSLEILANGNSTIQVEGKKIHLNINGETKVRWMGDQYNFPDVSLHRILNAPANDPELTNLLSGKLIFIGSTAIGAHDLRNTPINPQLPGVYSHINMAHMLEKAYYYKPADDSIIYSIIILSIGVIILLIAQYFNNPIIDIVVTAAILYSSYYVDLNYLLPKGYEIRLFFTFFSIVSIYSWNTFLNFSKSNKEKKQIKGTFSKYVAPDIVNEMLSHPDKLKVGGEKRDITCLFSDVRDFTSISEMLTPQELSKCLNIYMGRMTDIVFDTQGTLDKYIGDAIVAYWGAPLDVENHPQKAVLAAIEMIDVLPEVNEELKSLGFPKFKIGIGLNSGECSLGNMGSDKIFSYTALGDNMNLGARLEALCKYYGSLVTISEFTFNRIDPNVIRCRKLDKVRVKGKTEPVEIYEALHSTHYFKTNDEDWKKYQKAFDLYYDKNFTESLSLFRELHEKYPEDKACLRYIEWNETYIATPPPADWDGIFTHTTKG